MSSLPRSDHQTERVWLSRLLGELGGSSTQTAGFDFGFRGLRGSIFRPTRVVIQASQHYNLPAYVAWQLNEKAQTLACSGKLMAHPC